MPRGGLLKRQPSSGTTAQLTSGGSSGTDALDKSTAGSQGRISSGKADASIVESNATAEPAVEKTKKSFTKKLFGRLTGSDAKKKEAQPLQAQSAETTQVVAGATQQPAAASPDAKMASPSGKSELTPVQTSSKQPVPGATAIVPSQSVPSVLKVSVAGAGSVGSPVPVQQTAQQLPTERPVAGSNKVVASASQQAHSPSAAATTEFAEPPNGAGHENIPLSGPLPEEVTHRVDTLLDSYMGRLFFGSSVATDESRSLPATSEASSPMSVRSAASRQGLMHFGASENSTPFDSAVLPTSLPTTSPDNTDVYLADKLLPADVADAQLLVQPDHDVDPAVKVAFLESWVAHAMEADAPVQPGSPASVPLASVAEQQAVKIQPPSLDVDLAASVEDGASGAAKMRLESPTSILQPPEPSTASDSDKSESSVLEHRPAATTAVAAGRKASPGSKTVASRSVGSSRSPASSTSGSPAGSPNSSPTKKRGAAVTTSKASTGSGTTSSSRLSSTTSRSGSSSAAGGAANLLQQKSTSKTSSATASRLSGSAVRKPSPLSRQSNSDAAEPTINSSASTARLSQQSQRTTSKAAASPPAGTKSSKSSTSSKASTAPQPTAVPVQPAAAAAAAAAKPAAAEAVHQLPASSTMPQLAAVPEPAAQLPAPEQLEDATEEELRALQQPAAQQPDSPMAGLRSISEAIQPAPSAGAGLELLVETPGGSMRSMGAFHSLLPDTRAAQEQQQHSHSVPTAVPGIAPCQSQVSDISTASLGPPAGPAAASHQQQQVAEAAIAASVEHEVVSDYESVASEDMLTSDVSDTEFEEEVQASQSQEVPTAADASLEEFKSIGSEDQGKALSFLNRSDSTASGRTTSIDSTASAPKSTRLVRAVDVDPDPPKTFNPTPEARQASKALLAKLAAPAPAAAAAPVKAASPKLVDLPEKPKAFNPTPETRQASKELLAKLSQLAKTETPKTPSSARLVPATAVDPDPPKTFNPTPEARKASKQLLAKLSAPEPEPAVRAPSPARLVRAVDVDPDPPKTFNPTPEARQASKALLAKLASAPEPEAERSSSRPRERISREEPDEAPKAFKPSEETLQASKALLAKLSAPEPEPLVTSPAPVRVLRAVDVEPSSPKYFQPSQEAVVASAPIKEKLAAAAPPPLRERDPSPARRISRQPEPEPAKAFNPSPEVLQQSKALLAKLQAPPEEPPLRAPSPARVVRAVEVEPPSPKYYQPPPEAIESSKALLAKLATPEPALSIASSGSIRGLTLKTVEPEKTEHFKPSQNAVVSSVPLFEKLAAPAPAPAGLRERTPAYKPTAGPTDLQLPDSFEPSQAALASAVAPVANSSPLARFADLKPKLASAEAAGKVEDSKLERGGSLLGKLLRTGSGSLLGKLRRSNSGASNNGSDNGSVCSEADREEARRQAFFAQLHEAEAKARALEAAKGRGGSRITSDSAVLLLEAAAGPSAVPQPAVDIKEDKKSRSLVQSIIQGFANKSVQPENPASAPIAPLVAFNPLAPIDAPSLSPSFTNVAARAAAIQAASSDSSSSNLLLLPTSLQQHAAPAGYQPKSRSPSSGRPSTVAKPATAIMATVATNSSAVATATRSPYYSKSAPLPGQQGYSEISAAPLPPAEPEPVQAPADEGGLPSAFRLKKKGEKSEKPAEDKNEKVDKPEKEGSESRRRSDGKERREKDDRRVRSEDDERRREERRRRREREEEYERERRYREKAERHDRERRRDHRSGRDDKYERYDKYADEEYLAARRAARRSAGGGGSRRYDDYYDEEYERRRPGRSSRFDDLYAELDYYEELRRGGRSSGRRYEEDEYRRSGGGGSRRVDSYESMVSRSKGSRRHTADDYEREERRRLPRTSSGPSRLEKHDKYDMEYDKYERRRASDSRRELEAR